MRATGLAALASVLVLAGCERKPIATYVSHAGSLALSRDDAFLYAADADNGLVAVVDTAAGAKVAEVKVGRQPARVVVGPDDTVYVSNRGERSVSVIRRGQWEEAARVAVGVEPTGLAVSADGATLFVVNSTAKDSTEHGTLQAIDTKTLTARWELPVGREPRGVALLENGTALVSLYYAGDVVQVDVSDKPRVVKAGTELYSRANALKIRSRSGLGNAQASLDPLTPMPSAVGFHPRGMADVVVAPDGKRAFAPTQWAREDPVGTPNPGIPGGGGGSLYGGGGPCNGGPIASPGLATFEAETATPLVDDLGECQPDEDEPDFPPTTLSSPDPTHPIQGPTAAVVDPSGAWLFVVNHETDNVAVMPARGRTTAASSSALGRAGAVRQVVRVGAGPNGIALTRDGRKAYVYNSFDHTLSTLVSDGSDENAVLRESGARLKLAEEVLPPDVAAGRRLFFSAIDTRMTSNNVGAACATCHLEGREDGHTWNFPDGPRQTPSLAGRMMGATGPYHWSGEFSSLREFMDITVRERMGGGQVDTRMTSQLLAFIDAQPAADNPHRRETLTEPQQRGALVFKKAGCDGCHTGVALTNNSLADVGTFVVSGVQPDNEQVRQRGLNTPSLLGLARSAPYLHDGSAPTLKARMNLNRDTDQHGLTSRLSDAEVDDLIEYLLSL
ncbi:c-type cytochrome [Myxococcaceae bacterium GXIMD 01537]